MKQGIAIFKLNALEKYVLQKKGSLIKTAPLVSTNIRFWSWRQKRPKEEIWEMILESQNYCKRHFVGILSPPLNYVFSP